MLFLLPVAYGCFGSAAAGLNGSDREHMACKTQIFTIRLFIEEKLDRPPSAGRDGKKMGG